MKSIILTILFLINSAVIANDSGTVMDCSRSTGKYQSEKFKLEYLPDSIYLGCPTKAFQTVTPSIGAPYTKIYHLDSIRDNSIYGKKLCIYNATKFKTKPALIQVYCSN